MALPQSDYNLQVSQWNADQVYDLTLAYKDRLVA